MMRGCGDLVAVDPIPLMEPEVPSSALPSLQGGFSLS